MSIKKKDYKSLDTDIIDFVGGEENINRVIHCITRLRYYLKDETILEKETLEHLDDVIGIVEANGQFQVVVGQAVDDIYDEVIAQLSPINIEEKEPINENLSFFEKVKRTMNQLIGIITGSMMPIISILVASGIIKSLLALLTTAGLVVAEGSIYLMINAMADAVFYFLPI